MKAVIDQTKCIGCGMCVGLCEKCFVIEGNHAKFVDNDSCECDLNEVAESCPVSAIKVV